MMESCSAPPGCAGKGASKGGGRGGGGGGKGKGAPQPGVALKMDLSASTPASAVAPSESANVQQQQQQRPEARNSGNTSESAEPQLGRDYTKVPEEMDKRFESMDTDGALRPTIVSPGKYWRLRRQKALL